MKRRLWRMIHDRSGYTGLPLAFKGLLLVGLLAIAAVLVYSTHTMVNELKASEARLANAYAGQWKRAAESTEPAEVDYLFEQIIIKSDFPIIVADPNGRPLYWRGLPGIAETDTSTATRRRIMSLMDQMADEYPAVPITYRDRLLYRLHYGNYRLLSAVRRLPYIGIAVMILFLVIAYVGFRNIKRAEQRYIWVGMAKETAHQLGTPLSSLMGWLEHLSERTRQASYQGERTEPNGLDEIIAAMRTDIDRLRDVANRFGQIGSEPDRTLQPVEPIVKDVVSYFRTRLPHAGRGVTIEDQYQPTQPVPVNAGLIAWVLENLLKNSLQAVDPKAGRIRVLVAPYEGKGGGVAITVEDNGAGIPPREQKRIFHAGFTTKKRGWGLGLTLARRIVMEYHNGDIYLDTSIPHERTRLVLHLPA